MPRRRPDNVPVVIPSNSLVASSTRYTGKVPRIYHPENTWQKECYRHYHICGEARFAAKFFGHAISRATLHAAQADGTPITEGKPAEVLNALFRGPDGQKQILEALGLHLTIAGDCYLVGRTVNGADVWEVVSVLEMKTFGDRWMIDYGDGKPIELTEQDAVIRIWIPNPSKHIEADSPFRTMLPILREIEWLTRHVFAQISSRLAGAGILFLPQGVTFPPPPGQEGRQEPLNEADAFMQSLGDAMLAPIDDPGSAAAVVPHVAMLPGEQIDTVKLMHFWSDLDAHSKELRQEAIRRFALGMDLPPEQILGMSSNSGTGGGNSNGISHWGAWQIEEATIKMHIEPMLDVVTNSLTVSYFRVAMDEAETDEVVAYSTESLRLRPDRSKEAFELWDRGVLKTEVLLKENGFRPTDAPDDEEFKRWMLVKIASGSATPEQVQAALQSLGVPIEVSGEGTRPSLPAPSLVDHPSKPRTPDESALLAASDALVYRALERAGNRLRQAGVKPPGVPSYETHLFVKVNGNASQLLADAWSCAPQVLDGIGDPQKVVPVLESYCQGLLISGTAHTKERLAKWMVGQ